MWAKQEHLQKPPSIIPKAAQGTLIVMQRMVHKTHNSKVRTFALTKCTTSHKVAMMQCNANFNLCEALLRAR